MERFLDPFLESKLNDLIEKSLATEESLVSLDKSSWQTISAMRAGNVVVEPAQVAVYDEVEEDLSVHNPTATEQPIIKSKITDISLLNIWKSDVGKLITFFAIVPMLIPTLAGMFSTQEFGKYLFYFWGTYFCLLWSGVFALLLKPKKEVFMKGIKFGFFTAIIGMALLFIVQGFPVISGFYKQINSHSLIEKIIGFVLGVGICEEVCKLLPLFIWRKDLAKLPASSVIFLGMISGFGFAIPETAGQYAIKTAAQTALRTQMNNGFDFYAIWGMGVSGILLRLITLPILHAAWTGICSWYLWKALQERKEDFYKTLCYGIGYAALIHGIYDVACSYPHWYIVLAVISLLSLCQFVALAQGDDNFLNKKINY